MSKYSIKICRVNDVHTARFLARCKVDYLGLHAIFGLPNRRQLAELRRIIEEMRDYYPSTKTVLVTRMADPDALLGVYKELRTDFVQWSAPVSRADKRRFLKGAKKYASDVEIFNVLSSTESGVDSAKDIVGDYVVIDKRFAGGTGTQTPRYVTARLVKVLKGKKILLAGGMGRVNVASWLSGISVEGVDIMSSMEVGPDDKRKDIGKITKYLRDTRGDTKLPILGIPQNKELVCRRASSIQGALQAIGRGVDAIFISASCSRKGLVAEIRSINHFVPVVVLGK